MIYVSQWPHVGFMINKVLRRANLIIHELLVWIVFLQQTEELDNVGILFDSQFEMTSKKINILTSESNL